MNDHNRGLAVESEDWKYIYLCYADENVPPAEELFHLKVDPDEMYNLAGNSGHREMLTMLQNAYDEYHAAWVKESVDLEAYTRMGKIFDRHVPWQEKGFRFNGSRGEKKWPDFLDIYKELTCKEFKSGEAEAKTIH